MVDTGVAGFQRIPAIVGCCAQSLPRPPRSVNFQFRLLPILTIPEEARVEAVVNGSQGIDVATLLVPGYRTITAVEVNPNFISLAKRYRDFNSGTYTDHLSERADAARLQHPEIISGQECASQ